MKKSTKRGVPMPKMPGAEKFGPPMKNDPAIGPGTGRGRIGKSQNHPLNRGGKGFTKES